MLTETVFETGYKAGWAERGAQLTKMLRERAAQMENQGTFMRDLADQIYETSTSLAGEGEKEK